jgi:L-ascorbate metabolism protein UlaG (beta-lactamase superfamily)
MEIEYKGGNCVVITYKKEEIVSDPNLSLIGLKDQGANAAVQLLTQERFGAPAKDETIVIDGPGEYEVQNCSVRGIAAAPHTSPEGPKTATMYRLDAEGITVAILGHVAAKLTDEQIEEVGVVDVLVIPVGGFGYTLEPKQAVDLVRSIEPKIVIPVHYAEEGTSYEVPQAPLEDFLKELGTPAEEPVTKLKLKDGLLPEKLTVYQITRTK